MLTARNLMRLFSRVVRGLVPCVTALWLQGCATVGARQTVSLAHPCSDFWQGRDSLRAPRAPHRGSILGRVYDARGKALDGALVLLQTKPTERMRGAIADRAGVFLLDSLVTTVPPYPSAFGLEFRHLGYGAQTHQVDVVGATTSQMCVVMQERAVVLMPVR
jgi:hypothetical protein